MCAKRAHEALERLRWSCFRRTLFVLYASLQLWLFIVANGSDIDRKGTQKAGVMGRDIQRCLFSAALTVQ
jgi:hypothetical protein